jgi:hypothetical protein
MRRIHAVFFDLQPVAIPQRRGAGNQLVAWQVVGIEDREGWLLIRWSHVGEHQACVFMHRISGVIEPILQGAVGGLAGRLKDPAVNVEQPAMIAAADALVADQAELERRSAMRAIWFQQADGAALVTEDDEVLSEDAQSPGKIAEFAGEGQLLVFRR